jgi:hypothetical protein
MARDAIIRIAQGIFMNRRCPIRKALMIDGYCTSCHDHNYRILLVPGRFLASALPKDPRALTAFLHARSYSASQVLQQLDASSHSLFLCVQLENDP